MDTALCQIWENGCGFNRRTERVTSARPQATHFHAVDHVLSRLKPSIRATIWFAPSASVQTFFGSPLAHARFKGTTCHTDTLSITDPPSSRFCGLCCCMPGVSCTVSPLLIGRNGEVQRGQVLHQQVHRRWNGVPRRTFCGKQRVIES